MNAIPINSNLANQIGRAFSFLPSVNLEYGTKHLAIQLGYYIIHWLDDSFVHIDLLSSKNVMAMIYPRYPSTQGCVKQLSQNIEKSYLKDVSIIQRGHFHLIIGYRLPNSSSSTILQLLTTK